jgi:hypothetical protein
MENNKTDNKLMEKGIAQLLGYIPYNNAIDKVECSHRSDGYDYGTENRAILRCEECGVFYEKTK